MDVTLGENTIWKVIVPFPLIIPCHAQQSHTEENTLEKVILL